MKVLLLAENIMCFLQLLQIRYVLHGRTVPSVAGKASSKALAEPAEAGVERWQGAGCPINCRRNAHRVAQSEDPEAEREPRLPR